MAVIAVCLAGAARAGDVENQGRAVLDKYQKTVVTVQLVTKQKISATGMGSQDNESKEEATGLVIDPSGLVVLSLSATDPTSMMSAMAGEMAEKFKIESNVSDVKILLDDGTEVPAQIVLRDKDLDLAYARPIDKPAQPMTAVDLSQAAEPQVLDPLVSLNRLGKVAGRAYAAGLERVQAIIRKPRKMFVPGNDPTHSNLGSPMFTLDGKIVGIVVMRTMAGEGRSMMSLMGGLSESVLPTIVPAADILEGAKQAPMQAAKEPAPEAPKTEAAAETPPAAPKTEAPAGK